MGKDSGQLSLTGDFEVFVIKVGLATEGRELGDGLEEVVVCVDGVALREPRIPVCLAED